MRLIDVIDLEVQLARDEGIDEAQLRARDRALYLQMAPAPAGQEALLAGWLAGLRRRFGQPRLGEQVATAQRLLGYGLTLLGLSLGWGTVEVLLRYEEGGTPVNVGYYVLVVVLGQLASLLALLLGLLLHRFWPHLPLLGDMRRLVGFAADKLQGLLQRAHPEGLEQLAQDRAKLRRLRTRASLYAPLEHGVLLSLTQLFGVAFNVGALASCARLVVFSDLAFSWSTSLTALSAQDVQRACELLSLPFRWLLPDAVPSLSLVEQTQYFRLEGRFSGASPGTRGDPQVAAQWWRFLIACTISYGLVPRALALAWVRVQLARALRQLPLDTPLVQRVLTRLTTPELATRAPELRPQSAEPAGLAQAPAPQRAGPAVLLLYRDIPTHPELLTRAIREQLQLDIVTVQSVGSADVQGDERVVERVRGGDHAVAVLAEAWEAPDKSLRTLLARLRSAIGPGRALHVVLLGEAHQDGFAAAQDADVRLYRDRLTLLQDPYLMVDVLTPERSAAQGAELGRPA